MFRIGYVNLLPLMKWRLSLANNGVSKNLFSDYLIPHFLQHRVANISYDAVHQNSPEFWKLLHSVGCYSCSLCKHTPFVYIIFWPFSVTPNNSFAIKTILLRNVLTLLYLYLYVKYPKGENVSPVQISDQWRAFHFWRYNCIKFPCLHLG